MSKAIYLDTGVLGMVTHPRANVEARACVQWLRDMLAAGAKVYVPEICDYELRREYVLNNSQNALTRLNALNAAIGYVPLNTRAMQTAADLWSQARKRGQSTAAPKELDADVILAAQAKVNTSSTDSLAIATTNVGHLARFVTALAWRDISAT